MSEAKIFAPGEKLAGTGEVSETVEKEAPGKEKKKLKFIDATREGTCSGCLNPYKIGDRIALLDRDPDPESAKAIFEPFHRGCLDDVLLKDLEEKK